MILAFKQRFKQPIIEETKIHTIREDQHDRWQTGMSIQMATGVRTKNYDCFRQDMCRGVQHIFMSYDWLLHISILDAQTGEFRLEELYYPEKEILAKNDGFASYEDFENWFIPVVSAKPNKVFSGKIIHWTDFRY